MILQLIFLRIIYLTLKESWSRCSMIYPTLFTALFIDLFVTLENGPLTD